MQKKLLVISLMIVFVLMLTACGSSASAAANNTDAAPVTTMSSEPVNLEEAADQTLNLAVGLFNLRNSQTPIDAAQASQLIPVLEKLQTLLSGSTYDALQIQSAVDAVKAVLTAEQIQAITDMGPLTIDDLTFGGRNGGAMGTPDPAMQGTMTGGQAPGKGQPAGTPDPSMQATLAAGGQTPGNGQGGPQGQPPSGAPGADGSNPQGGSSMQTTIENIKNATVAPGLNPDLIGLVISSLQIVK